MPSPTPAPDFILPPLGPTPAPGPGGARAHILTVALEDYFQVGAFNRFVQKNQWYRFETRLEQTTRRTLGLLKEYDAKATFFVLGWVARRFPELIKQVADAGHEVGIKGYYHRGIREMTPEEFQLDCERARDAVEAATGRRVVGYRLADGWFGPEDLWALDALAEMGFGYDSSIAPMQPGFRGQTFRRFVHAHEHRGRAIWEVPISTARVCGVTLPVAGGNYLRQLPAWVTRRAVDGWVAGHASPLVAYFHVWELDPDQPRLAIGGWLTRKRHYRNLHAMESRLRWLLAGRRFTSVAAALGLPLDGPCPARPLSSSDSWAGDGRPGNPGVVAPPLSSLGMTQTPPPRGAATPVTPVTVVVPCFNEEESLHYLGRTLDRLRESLADRYDVRFVLVDDGSTDRTWEKLESQFRARPATQIHRHPANFGVAAAIMTGLRRADTEVVASIDCDCTYDPLELRDMLPLLQPGVDLVTASPYHPQGRVRNVPAWRLVLSRGAAWLYRRVLRQKLATYTSCFRVYRRSSVAPLNLTHGGFLGVAELLGRLDLAGGAVVEHPATLEVRMLGRSKMKTARTVGGHLRLMARLAWLRLKRTWARPHRDEVIRSVIVSHEQGRTVLTRPPKPADSAAVDVRRAVVNPPATPEPTRR